MKLDVLGGIALESLEGLCEDRRERRATMLDGVASRCFEKLDCTTRSNSLLMAFIAVVSTRTGAGVAGCAEGAGTLDTRLVGCRASFVLGIFFILLKRRKHA
jgi:hypothetical protein